MFKYLDDLQIGKFNFDNEKRNEYLLKKGIVEKPSILSTGTTIVGLIYKVKSSSLRPDY
jgi:hypothetical protein